MKVFGIALAATLVCGWLLLDLLESFDGIVGLFLLAAAAAVLLSVIWVLYQKLSDLQRRVEALEKEREPREKEKPEG